MSNNQCRIPNIECELLIDNIQYRQDDEFVDTISIFYFVDVEVRHQAAWLSD